MKIEESYIGFNPNRQIIASDDYSTNSSDILATTKCVANALETYTELSFATKANESEVVHNTGNEKIYGNKIFTGTTREGIEDNAAGFVVQNTNFIKGMIDKNYYWTVAFIDNNENSDELKRRIGIWEAYTDSAGDAFNGFVVYKNVDETQSQVLAGIQIKFTSDNIKAFVPRSTNDTSMGQANFRWKDIIAASTAISTSDKRLKMNIEDVSDKVLDAWSKVSWKQFKMKDAVEQKGADNARTHNGLIAQEIDEIFKKNKLNARDYGLFCYDEWNETTDGNGNKIPAGNQYSLRYEEALCLEAAYQRRRANKAEERITKLEKKLAELEKKLA